MSYDVNNQDVPLLRSILFVPATRPDRFEKAIASGADSICIDLEDSVAADAKDSAREQVSNWFSEHKKQHNVLELLRINSPDELAGIHDLLLLSNLPRTPDIVLLPKVESAATIEQLNSVLTSCHRSVPWLALLETPKGLDNAADIAAVDNVMGLCFGSADYTRRTGSNMGWDALLHGRNQIVQAAAGADVAAFDGAWLDLEDTEGLLKETEKVATLGFSGRPALHPRQVANIHRGFAPTEHQLTYARKVVSSFEQQGDGVLVVEGRMVDAPVVHTCRRLLAIHAKNRGET